MVYPQFCGRLGLRIFALFCLDDVLHYQHLFYIVKLSSGYNIAIIIGYFIEILHLAEVCRQCLMCTKQ